MNFTIALAAGLVLALGEAEPVQVTDAASGCYHRDERQYTWQRTGDTYTRGGARLPVAEVEALRVFLLANRKEPADLLSKVGFTPESLAAHHDAILGLVLPPTWRDASGRPLPVPRDLMALLSYEHLSGPIRTELLGEQMASTNRNELTVVLPGEPPIRIHSDGVVPWMLPWSITAGRESWVVADPAISTAMLELVDPAGPSARVLRGAPYWTDAIWKDEGLWERLVGRELVKRLAELQSADLPGFADFDRRFVVVDAMSGAINMQPESAYYVVAARGTQLVDGARWWNPLREGARTRTWTDFLKAFDEVAAVAARQGWLAEWKSAGPDRHIEAQIVGVTPLAETSIEEFLQPAWAHAGLAGTPEVELILRRGNRGCGTVFLARDDQRAIITSAQPGPGGHWFDQLDLFFHPRAEPPTYGLVDKSGRCVVRKIRSSLR